MKNRTLTIRRDSLGELSNVELESVAGGVSGILCLGPLTSICPTWDCTGCYLTCGC
jgi:hypothetical protein